MSIKLTPDILLGFQQTYLVRDYDTPVATPACHLEWWDMCLSKKKFVAIAAPRSHAKSTTITYALPLALACFRLKKHVLIVSDTEKQAVDFLGDIKAAIMENESLRLDFSIGEIVKDAETEFIFRFTDDPKKWVRFIAKGSNQKLRGLKYRGARPDYVICDDMENEDLVANKVRRDKLLKWFLGSLIPSVSRTGQIRVVGTVLSYDSLLMHLLQNKEWKSKRYEAHNKDFSQILWPEMWSRARLEATRNMFAADGKLDIYSQEYLNEPILEGNAYFQRHWVRIVDRQEIPTRNCRCVIAGDVAITKQTRSDYSVFVVGLIGPTGNIYVADIIRARLGAEDLVEEIFRLHQQYEPELFMFEHGVLSHALWPMILNKAQRMGIMPNVPSPTSKMRLVPTQDKEYRAKPLQALMKAGQVAFVGGLSEWENTLDELMKFPLGKHDDIIDALAWLAKMIHLLPKGQTDEEIYDEEYEAERSESSDSGRSSVTGY